MKSLSIINLKKFQKKNLNKFFKLKSKNSLKNNVISISSGLLKDTTLNNIDLLLKKIHKGVKWNICIRKNRTKKPISSKLGGGKGKPHILFSILKKYNTVIRLPPVISLKKKIKLINKINKVKLKQNVSAI